MEKNEFRKKVMKNLNEMTKRAFLFRIAVEFPVRANRWEIIVQIPQDIKYSLHSKDEIKKAFEGAIGQMMIQAGLLDWINKIITGEEDKPKEDKQEENGKNILTKE